MSLFPAYAPEDEVSDVNIEGKLEWNIDSIELSRAQENELLASSSDSDGSTPAPVPVRAASPPREYYEDCRRDVGNLRVSTLYYPGRPEYRRRRRPAAPPAAPRPRYFSAPPAPPAPRDSAERAARRDAFRKALEETPGDEEMWLRFIDFEEILGEEGSGAAASRAAFAARPHCRAILMRALHHAEAKDVMTYIEQEQDPSRLPLLWSWWVRASCRSPAPPAALRAAAHAARRHPPAYPHVLLQHARVLVSAGLWEELVLLLELALSMSLPPGPFPPPAPARDPARDELADYEDKVINSGLPLGTRWARVETARAAAHWRPAPGPEPDPQRRPPAPAALLQPAPAPRAAWRLASAALRAAQIPLLPHTAYMAAALGGADERMECLLLAAAGAGGVGDEGGAGRGGVPVALLDPPSTHHKLDKAGFSSWVSSLWDGVCASFSGAARDAFLCWMMRYMAAQVKAGYFQPESLDRVRRTARALLRPTNGDSAQQSALPFAECAKLEHVLRECGARGGARGEAARTAARAMSAAVRAQEPGVNALYIARIIAEIAGPSSDIAQWALCDAVLQKVGPHDEGPPPSALKDEALRVCELQCSTLESQFSTYSEDACSAEPEPAPWAVLLPGAGEWARALVRLAPAPSRRPATPRAHRSLCGSGDGARYYEEQAEALTALGCSPGPLAQPYPDNVYLNIMCSREPLWRSAVPPRGAVGAVAGFCAVLPTIYRAHDSGWAQAECAALWRRISRVCPRVCPRACALGAARLEAGARAARGGVKRALCASGENEKWLYVRAASWGLDARSLADLLLDRMLRIHALPDELHPLTVPADDSHLLGEGAGPGLQEGAGPEKGAVSESRQTESERSMTGSDQKRDRQDQQSDTEEREKLDDQPVAKRVRLE